MRRAYKFRIKTGQAVEARLAETLELCRELYNACLTERRAAYRMCGHSVNYYEQHAELPGLKEACPEYKTLYSDCLTDVLERVQRAYDGFFRRIKAGQKAGFPRYKGRERYDSVLYKTRKSAGWRLEGDKLTLSKIGSMRVKLSRAVEGKIKTVTIKREGAHWYAVFTCNTGEREAERSAASAAVGIDVGIKSFLTTSDGRAVENPRTLKASEGRLKKAQRRLSHKKRGSGKRRRARARLAKLHRKIANRRKDFLHKLSRKLVNRYDLICFEDLNIAGMLKNHKLAKHIADAAWGMFLRMLVYKAEGAGKRAVNVAARYTSQECSGCREKVLKALSVRWHTCSHCGLELHRDHNAARNILKRGRILVSAAGLAVAAPGGLTMVEPMKGEPLHNASSVNVRT
jgi:putative transposase